MFTYFFVESKSVYVVQAKSNLQDAQLEVLSWLLEATYIEQSSIAGVVNAGPFIGPRKELISPWSSNACDIVRNVGIESVVRIERFEKATPGAEFDPMLQSNYETLDANSLVIDAVPMASFAVEDLRAFNASEGLALSDQEVTFLEAEAEKLGRKLTDCEVYGFAQINSEHCRHKIFNGSFVLDGKLQELTLFQWIKKTSKAAPHYLVSAYRDNVAFIKGCPINHFSPGAGWTYSLKPRNTLLSLKAETHNFPTAVEPFYGASTGSGGEIRDRMAGGRGSIPLAGTAVYMTAYSRVGEKTQPWEEAISPRPWKYQTPQQILTKASNGASDFGNKFGQPLIVGSLLTFEGQAEISTNSRKPSAQLYAYDRCVMLAGGVGFADARDGEKEKPAVGDQLILLGGDNYRIGMGGGAVSSVNTGQYASHLELNAVQRANPEMQKRVFNVLRTLTEQDHNPIKSVHDHGAGGHINCFSELYEGAGGRVEMAKLPIGDPTLSSREIIANESQERMGLILSKADLADIATLSERERAPCYVVGEVTGDRNLVFECADGSTPVKLPLDVLLGSSPKTIVEDHTAKLHFSEPVFSIANGYDLRSALEAVLRLEGVACKDWLTNKVDRCVSGRVALQQCTGPLHLPLNDAGIMALDYSGTRGVVTSLGAAPVVGLIDEQAGSVLSVAEALTNLMFAPLEHGLEGVALSANWMWPAGNPGEGCRLYRAVEALSHFAQELKVPVPTGKDSLSMTMKYEGNSRVLAPGTVIVSAVALVSDVKLAVSAELKEVPDSKLLYIDLSGVTNGSDPILGGSAFAQVHNGIGGIVPNVLDIELFKQGFAAVQELLNSQKILAGHDISDGGLITCVAEMAMVGQVGVALNLDLPPEQVVSYLFSEKPGVVMQVKAEDVADVCELLFSKGLPVRTIGEVDVLHANVPRFTLNAGDFSFHCPVDHLLLIWLERSLALESYQTTSACVSEKLQALTTSRLDYILPAGFSGSMADYGVNPARVESTNIRAAVVREQGTNGEREMAIALHSAGFEVVDITMSDLTRGKASLEDVQFVVFPGGFANGDVLGAGRGWAGVFKYHSRARRELEKFYSRSDTLSLGVCNGCQLMMALGLVDSNSGGSPIMRHNLSQKFESIFVTVDACPTSSIMLKPLVGSRLGIWIAHGEGRFSFPEEDESYYDLPLKYSNVLYPFNPNGSDFRAAAIVSTDGRHLAMMPHLERSIFSWQWPYPGKYRELSGMEITPWMLAFIGAREWLQNK